MLWLGYCASLMLSFLPTRTARSTNIKYKDSDVVTDGTVGWRRRKIFSHHADGMARR